RDARGQIHFNSVDIPQAHLPDLARLLRQNLSNHPRLGNLFYQIEMRGTKGMYTFRFDDDEDRKDAFNRLVESLDLAEIDIDSWYIDVALEISKPFHVVQWTTNAHSALLGLALPSLTDAQVTTIHNSSYFNIDYSAHLYNVAGFRCSPGIRGREDEVSHINVYTTDKAVTYQLHKGAFSPHSNTSLFPGKISALLDDMVTMSRIFAQCAGAGGGAGADVDAEATTQDGTARFEVRVSLRQALVSLTEFPDELLAISTVCIPNAVWWDFKFYRLAAIHYVLKEFAKDPAHTRANVSSLTLGAAMIYMLNALVSRPSDWRAEKALAE
ncbi:hypothetical protein GY45DRAFT_1217208, partial [Cubamyces sp. BRFM 1775]